jgi:hypothetical protein
MRKVPPSEIVREEISHILEGGTVHSETNLLSVLSELGVRYLLQQALEQEQEDFLGRGHYERTRSQHSTGQRGYRNGYEDATLNTAEGRSRRASSAGERDPHPLPFEADGVS